MKRFIAVLIATLTLSPEAFADWYILLPKKPLPKHRKIPKNIRIPGFKEKKIKPKPYSVEVQKVLAPSFSISTKSGKIAKRDFEGKNVVVFFVKSLFSPFTEKLVSHIEKQSDKKTVFIVVSINDTDFASLDTFKKLMGVKKTVVTADSYLFYQFKSRLKNLKTPSVVVIDRFGFIRFFSPEVLEGNVSTVTAELDDILRSLSKG